MVTSSEAAFSTSPNLRYPPPNTMAAYTILSSNRVGPGTYYRISHPSISTKTPMTFGLFVPSRHVSNVDDGVSSSSGGGGKKEKEDVPAMFWLSGLTCDDTNFAMKAGGMAFLAADKEGIAIVMPDTSPRGDPSVPNVDR
eukprot:g2720.t1 g2720   contig12:676047-676466(+)